MKLPLRVCLLCIAVLVCGAALHNFHNGLFAAPPRSPTGPSGVEQAFVAASSNSPQAVANFVDSAMNCTVFAGSADSLRDRVVRSELAYRSGRRKPISLRRLSGANNVMASVAFAPAALHTTEDQIRLFRTVWHSEMPRFVGTSDALSPAEAVFLIGSLTQQKLLNPDFHLDQQAVDKLLAARQQPRAATYHTHLKVVSVPRPLADVQSALYEQLPREWSLGTVAVHAFFGLAGIGA